MRNRSRLTGPPTGRGNEAPLHSPDWFRKAEWELGLRAAVSARVRRRTAVRITNRYHSIAIGSNGYHCLAMAPRVGFEPTALRLTGTIALPLNFESRRTGYPVRI